MNDFCTAINCMDGRVQLPVLEYLKKYFNAPYVDSITEPAPNHILSERKNSRAAESIFQRIKISLEKHGSTGIAVTGHHDCAGFPGSKEVQNRLTLNAVAVIRGQFPGVTVMGLWVDANWKVWRLEESP